MIQDAASELRPVRQVDDDRGQRDGRDHQLEPRQERAGSDDAEQEQRRPASHAGSVRKVVDSLAGSTHIDINHR